MNRDERIEAVLAGKSPDRVPVSAWHHFSGDDQDPISLAAVTAEFNEAYDYDFIKMMPFGLYGVQDLGARLRIFSETGKPPEVLEYGIQSPADYWNLSVISGLQGTYGKQVEFAQALARRVPSHTPFIQTIFSPLTTLHKLAGDRILKDVKEHPNAVRHALAVITEITINFVKHNIEAGVSGFFFATQEARKPLYTESDFKRFGEFYDLQVIDSYSKKTWFNVVHIHGLDVYFDIVSKYPVPVVNWHDRDTYPSLKEARGLTNKTLLGGIQAEHHTENGKVVRHEIVQTGIPKEIIHHIHEAINEVDGKGLIIGPGCAIDPLVSDENLRAIRKAVD